MCRHYSRAETIWGYMVYEFKGETFVPTIFWMVVISKFLDERCNETGWDSFFFISLWLNSLPGSCVKHIHTHCDNDLQNLLINSFFPSWDMHQSIKHIPSTINNQMNLVLLGPIELKFPPLNIIMGKKKKININRVTHWFQYVYGTP